MQKALSVLKFILALYLFFLCIELIGGSFKLIGKESAIQLLQVTANPMVGLLLGILATSIVQSSSTTTSIVVGMVAAGTLTIPQAIPIVMGANIGTTITNTIVAMGHVRLRKEFGLAFTGATVHDFFNLCAVIVFLPLEILLHPIERLASAISTHLVGLEGATFQSPLKTIVAPVSQGIQWLGSQIISNQQVLGALIGVLSLVLLVCALGSMVKIMRGAVAYKLEFIVDRYLFTSTARTLIIGILVTAVVQSSSVTTSLVVPLMGTGIVRIESAFPYMVGANIGTTITAILASLVTGHPSALTIAISHLIFNILGATTFLPLKRIPIWLATQLGDMAGRRRWIALVYVVLVFFVTPGILIMLF